MVKHSVEWRDGEGLGGTHPDTKFSISALPFDMQHLGSVRSIGEESLGARMMRHVLIIECVITMQSNFHPFCHHEIHHDPHTGTGRGQTGAIGADF